MCGICGVCGNGGKTNMGKLKKMNSALTHRGPDDEGYYINSDRSAGLGIRWYMSDLMDPNFI